MFLFHGDLGETGVIATPFVVIKRRVVAGVTEHDRPRRAIQSLDAQHRHIGIDGAIGITANDEAFRRR